MGFIARILGSTIFESIFGAITGYLDRLHERRMAAIENGHDWKVKRLDAQIKALEFVRDRQEKPPHWVYLSGHALIVIPAISLLWTLVIWDTILGMGSRSISPFIGYYMDAVIVFYLGALGFKIYKQT